MRRILEQILAAPTWEDFKEQIYALHRQMFASTKNKFLDADHGAASWTTAAPCCSTATTPTSRRPTPVRQQTHKDLKAIVDAIAARNGKRAEELVSDHLMRTLATINIWQ